MPVVIANRAPCDVGYKFDGVSGCYMTSPKARGAGTIPDDCGDWRKVGITCWENCGPNQFDKGATCEDCGEGWLNNGASLCYKQCDQGYTYTGSFFCNSNYHTVGIGIIPNTCPAGTVSVGTACIDNPEPGYKVNPGDIVSYWLNEPLSYDIESTPNYQDNSACNDLSNVIHGVGSCTGWGGHLNCSTSGCGCIKQWVDKDCSSCNGLGTIIHGVNTCTGWDPNMNCTYWPGTC